MAKNDKLTTERTFATMREVLAFPAPADKAYDEIKHTTQPGFFVRIMKRDRYNEISRFWVARYDVFEPDGQGGTAKRNKKVTIGVAVAREPGEKAMTLEEALSRVIELRRAQRESRVEGSRNPRLTVGAAWEYYAAEKGLNRGTTHEKDKQQYERYLAPLADKFLDELGREFWTLFVGRMRAGTLTTKIRSKEGDIVEAMCSPLANATMHGIINTASALYIIAHKYKGLQGLERDENPAKEIKETIGKSRKRKTRIAIENVGPVFIAANQLLAPWWRDLLYITVLTGLRRSLLLALRFDQVDFERSRLRIDPRMKGTKRRGTEFDEDEDILLPVAPQVLRILALRRRFAPDQNGPVWYAPGTGYGKKHVGGVLTDQRFAWNQISDALGIPRFTPHDCRRTFADLGTAAILGDVLPVALLMMHTSTTLAQAVGLPEITVRYINTAAAQAKQHAAAQAIADYVDDLVDRAGAGQKYAGTQPELHPELDKAAEATD